ncbi:hypothetical protein Acsp06_62450 [Actinomycetospora sp. NBRC 106375]|uniref:hypothetical protein n=1 Tax=Actinomycetospora sp. NBRC 106375 TaxID=3032207 RepID=UPI0024A1F20C|nr:hypothetical protein [Actinomycetospora sp. NBRC 106375]GLZ50060.1 hypothetical protein Acsp06_62450 [Actinomycetospora sp. NBRC 106375]
MADRDRLERAVRGWHDLEAKSDSGAVIDFDCAPDVVGDEFADRFEVLDRLLTLRSEADGDVDVVRSADAHIAYARALLGERRSLTEYLESTQGAPGAGWTDDYIAAIGDVARRALADVDVAWNEHTRIELDSLSPAVTTGDAGDVIREYAREYEGIVRRLTGAESTFDLTVESVDVDAYWSYWLDGAGRSARMRINTRKASFTEVDAYRFALHEVLGHALQYANLTDASERVDVAWPRQLAVHCPHQVLFEGLAQVLPLAARPDDELVRARTRLDHYVQLVNSELHLMINDGADASSCRDHALGRAPFWRGGDVSAVLRDRSLDPQLRSYLWAYPAGIDWFLNLHDAGGNLLEEVLHAGYQRPLVPRELEQLWPAGPRIGGNA